MSDSLAPKVLDFLEVSLLTYSGQAFDITTNVTEFNLYEDIDSFFIHGEMTVFDNSGMLFDFPMIGQEAITIRFKRTGDPTQTIERQFFVTGVNNVSRVNEQTASFMLTLVSYYQVIDAQKMFSRSYSGLNTDIISKIYKDAFDRELDEVSEGGTSHNIVIPYSKPFAALNMLLKTTYAVDRTPLYLFETLYDNQVVLKSWGDMMGADVDEELGDYGNVTPFSLANKSEDGNAVRESNQWSTRFEFIKIKKAYDSFSDISQGNLNHQINTVDISRKNYTETTFDYTKNAKPIMSDYVQQDMREGITKYSRMRLQKTNDMAYSNLPILNSAVPQSLSAFGSYRRRRDTTVLQAIGPGMERLRCGRCVWVDMPLYMPMYSQGDEEQDIYQSGKYMVSAICHTYTKQKYEVTVELIRDGYNDQAEIN